MFLISRLKACRLTFLSLLFLGASLYTIGAYEVRELELSALASFDYSKPGADRSLFQSGSFHQGANQTLSPGRFELQISSSFGEKTRFFSQVDFDFADRTGENSIDVALGYFRFENINNRSFSMDIGRIPNPIGLFPRRKSAFENPLYGAPLIYDYRTSLRNDSFPGSPDELVQRKMSGNSLKTFKRNFVGDGLENTSTKNGLSLISSDNPLGIAVQTRKARIDYYLAVTNNSPANSETYAINSDQNIILRLEWTDFRHTRLAISHSFGTWMDNRLTPVGNFAPEKCNQTLTNFNLQYKRNSLELSSEIMQSSFEMPGFNDNLETLGYYFEARHFFNPRFYGALRQEALDFSEIQTTTGKNDWEEDVQRTELGFGHYIDESTLSKLFYQTNKHKNNDPDDDLWGMQISASF